MPRHCPSCSAKLSPFLFFLPKFIRQPSCPSCGSRIGYTGLFSWGVEIGYLLISYGIYRLIEGNFIQALAVMPIAVAIMILEYRFARLKVVA